MNRVLLILLFLISLSLTAQKKASWKSLGRAEKVWVLMHPFSAKKAQKLTAQAIHDADSIQKLLKFPNPESGGRKDALRHAYWMALMSNKIGPKRALWLGYAHEKAGKKDFEKGIEEDGSLADQTAMQMDLINNSFGVKVGKYCYECDQQKLLKTVLESLKKGELKIIKQNSKGDFLDEDNEIIPTDSWKGRWENERVLINSGF
ncbi:MAG: hypothetical protein RJQ00_11515 [Vicingaceae bacterium]